MCDIVVTNQNFWLHLQKLNSYDQAIRWFNGVFLRKLYEKRITEIQESQKFCGLIPLMTVNYL
jgi:hypothetical protein